jgi:hypothetical protein
MIPIKTTRIRKFQKKMSPMFRDNIRLNAVVLACSVAEIAVTAAANTYNFSRRRERVDLKTLVGVADTTSALKDLRRNHRPTTKDIRYRTRKKPPR